jgi:hypothetical protein
MNKLIDFVAGFLKAQGLPSNQIKQYQEYIKFLMKIFFAVIKVVVPEQI